MEIPSADTIGLIAASLIRSNKSDPDSAIRDAILLWKRSEAKLGALKRFLAEIGSEWEEWARLDADPERLREWNAGKVMVTESLAAATASRIADAKTAAKELGAKGPPSKHPFTIHAVADKILPQKNPTERRASTLRFLHAEIESLDEESPVRQWLEKTADAPTKEHDAWWIWAEILVRHQRREGRFRQGDRWKRNLAERRRQAQPEGRWDEFS